MKKVLATIAEWFAIVGVLCALVGFIFPPAGMYRIDSWSDKEAKWLTDWDWLSLGTLMSSDGSPLVVAAIVLMVVALIATFYFAVVAKVSKKPVAGLFLLGAVAVGVLCALYVRNVLIVNPTNHMYIGKADAVKDSLGVYIMGVAYLLQVVGAVLAVVVSFMKSAPEEKAE